MRRRDGEQERRSGFERRSDIDRRDPDGIETIPAETVERRVAERRSGVERRVASS